MRIAAAHDSSISIDELFLLLPGSAFSSASDLKAYINSDPFLREEMSVSVGEVTVKGSEHLGYQRADRIALSLRRSAVAQSFSDRIAKMCPWIRLVAISGSTAYRGPRAQDDIDLFIVTRPNRVWITLLLALVVAKVQRLRGVDSTQFCFNRVLEETECTGAFNSLQGPLFAREALSLKILLGRGFYRDLIRSSSWMEGTFPRLYRDAIRGPSADDGQAYARPHPLWSLLDGVAHALLAPYLTIVGYRRNATLLRQGRRDSLFRTVIRRGFFAVESRKYDFLREIYRDAVQEV